jgi:hypothetical protein
LRPTCDLLPAIRTVVAVGVEFSIDALSARTARLPNVDDLLTLKGLP